MAVALDSQPTGRSVQPGGRPPPCGGGSAGASCTCRRWPPGRRLSPARRVQSPRRRSQPRASRREWARLRHQCDTVARWRHRDDHDGVRARPGAARVRPSAAIRARCTGRDRRVVRSCAPAAPTSTAPRSRSTALPASGICRNPTLTVRRIKVRGKSGGVRPGQVPVTAHHFAAQRAGRTPLRAQARTRAISRWTPGARPWSAGNRPCSLSRMMVRYSSDALIEWSVAGDRAAVSVVA